MKANAVLIVATGTSGPTSAPDAAKAMKANAARIVGAIAMSGPMSARGVAIGAIGARAEATGPRAIPRLVRRRIAECVRVAPIQVDARTPACVTAAQEEVRVAATEAVLDKVSADVGIVSRKLGREFSAVGLRQSQKPRHPTAD